MDQTKSFAYNEDETKYLKEQLAQKEEELEQLQIKVKFY